jgi:5-methyltetrahydropteroyltriglutamate--homocysteine methyltransferase
MRVLAVCGSLRSGSANLELLERAASAAPRGVELVIFDGLARLPHFDPDLEASGPPPPAVTEWRRALESSQALLIASPEYGHSLPGTLKNAIDWVIGTGQLERKIVAVTASVAGADRGRRGLEALCQTLGAVSARIVGGEPIVRGETAAEEIRELLRALADEVRRSLEPPPTAPFRAEHVGSLLRPAVLKRAMADARAGSIGRTELESVQDRCIRRVAALQEAVGLAVVTDGEFRRTSFQHFLEHLEGAYVGRTEPPPGAPPKAFEPRTYTVTGKLRRRPPGEVENFRYLRSVTERTPKITLASPTMLLRAGRDQISREAYPDLDEYRQDIVAVYRAEIRSLADAGCTYVQLDDTNFAYLCDPSLSSRRQLGGEDPARLPHRYAGLINAALAERPPAMAACIHICRGNNAGRFAARGGYEPVAEVLLNELDVDGYFLEYDDARSGGFEPLRFLPERSAKKIVLGLITTKSPELEDKDALKRRIDEAAKHVPLENLCLSPQCGFASVIEGNPLSEDDERRKLELVVQTAREVWGP